MRKLAILTIAASLSACGFDSPSQQAAETPSKPIPAAEVPVQREVDAPAEPVDRIPQFVERLTEGGRGHFRFDRIRDVEGTGKERQVFVEMVGATDVEAAQEAKEGLESLGFRELRRNESPRSIRVAYEDPDGATIQINVRSREAHPKLKHDDATSSVYFTQIVEE